MDQLCATLVVTAIGIGLAHTVLGPDHYLPFVMLARARHWTVRRTLLITGLCGLGHVMASIILGAAGLGLGVALGTLEAVEKGRGDWAAWLLVAFGLAYGAWGLRRGIRQRKGLEPHQHGHHVHVHAAGAVPHQHGSESLSTGVTFWPLFLAFVLGPCEPLIPLFVVPASRGEWTTALVTAVAFSVTTISTMLVVTLLGLWGLRRLPLGPLERWSHAVAGGVVAASGLAIVALGL